MIPEAGPPQVPPPRHPVAGAVHDAPGLSPPTHTSESPVLVKTRVFANTDPTVVASSPGVMRGSPTSSAGTPSPACSPIRMLSQQVNGTILLTTNCSISLYELNVALVLVGGPVSRDSLHGARVNSLTTVAPVDGSSAPPEK